MWVSLICAVHCVAMPVVFLAAPALTATVAGLEWVEWVAAGIAFATTLLQVWPEYQMHRKPQALRLAAVGLVLIAGGLLVEALGGPFAWHTLAMVLGSLFMAAAFYKGHRLRHHSANS